MKFECSGSPRKKKKNEGVLTIYFSFELLSRCCTTRHHRFTPGVGYHVKGAGDDNIKDFLPDLYEHIFYFFT